MKLGMIGLGKMGGNMAERLRRHDHTVVGMDPGVKGADARTLDELVPLLGADGQPRIAWAMVPAGPITDDTIAGLGDRLSKGDIVIVPHGVPHQFVQVTNPFLYYVVKVR